MALDPRWMGPPEIVAAILEAGPGPESTIANQLVWITETIGHELSMGVSAANTAATAAQWMGLGGTASAGTATSLNGELQTLAGWTTHKVSVVQAAVDAYAVALPAVVPSLVCQTNRDESAALNASNILGQNTPAIIERDLEYFGEHWPHNSGVGLAYSGTLSALTAALAVPPPLAPVGVPPAAPATAGASAAQAAAEPAEAVGAPAQAGLQGASSRGMTGPLSSALQQGPQLATGAAEPLNSVGKTAGQAFQGVSNMPQTMMGTVAPAQPAGVAANAAAAEPVAAGSVRAGGTAAGGVGSGGAGGYSGAPLTSFTRPASTFTPEEGGRPVGRAGVLNAAELRGPTTAPAGGAGMPVSPAGAGMLGRSSEGAGKPVARARIVADDHRDR